MKRVGSVVTLCSASHGRLDVHCIGHALLAPTPHLKLHHVERDRERERKREWADGWAERCEKFESWYYYCFLIMAVAIGGAQVRLSILVHCIGIISHTMPQKEKLLRPTEISDSLSRNPRGPSANTTWEADYSVTTPCVCLAKRIRDLFKWNPFFPRYSFQETSLWIQNLWYVCMHVYSGALMSLVKVEVKLLK